MKEKREIEEIHFRKCLWNEKLMLVRKGRNLVDLTVDKYQ